MYLVHWRSEARKRRWLGYVRGQHLYTIILSPDLSVVYAVSIVPAVSDPSRQIGTYMGEGMVEKAKTAADKHFAQHHPDLALSLLAERTVKQNPKLYPWVVGPTDGTRMHWTLNVRPDIKYLVSNTYSTGEEEGERIHVFDVYHFDPSGHASVVDSVRTTKFLEGQLKAQQKAEQHLMATYPDLALARLKQNPAVSRSHGNNTMKPLLQWEAHWARENPEVKPIPKLITAEDDEVGIRRVSNFLSHAYHPDLLLSRLGRAPTEQEAVASKQAQQRILVMRKKGDWSGLNRALAPFLRGQIAPPPGWVVPAQTPKRSPRPVSRDTSELYERMTRRAEKILGQTIGPPWSHPKMLGGAHNLDGRRAMTQDVLTRAWEKAGSLDRVEDLHLREAAAAVRKEWRAAGEREMKFGEYVESEGTAAREEDDEPSTVSGADIDTLLRSLAQGDLYQQTVALMVGLHFGRPMMDGQPGSLRGGQPLKNLKSYHSFRSRREGVCPTCRAISRFIRIPGSSPEYVSQQVDSFLVRTQSS